MSGHLSRAAGTVKRKPLPPIRDEPSKMSTVTTMTLLCYDQRLKVYVYQDDANGNTWKTHPKRRYGELVPSNRQVWDYDSQLRPRPDLGEHPKPRTWRNIYLTDPRYEVYTPNGMRKKGAMLGIIWRHDHDEGWDVLVDHWPAHLVRRMRHWGEPQPRME